MKKILGILAALLCVHAAFAIEIEAALAETADQFSKTLKAGSTIAIIGISSDTEEMSDFMLDELTVNFVKLRKLKVADRANLAAIKKEMNFQLSGEVGDDSIQQIGAMAGAQTVIRGNMKQIGDTYLLVIHALNVTTAAIEDMYRKKIEPNETTLLLLGDNKSGSAMAKKQLKKMKKSKATKTKQKEKEGVVSIGALVGYSHFATKANVEYKYTERDSYYGSRTHKYKLDGSENLFTFDGFLDVRYAVLQLGIAMSGGELKSDHSRDGTKLKATYFNIGVLGKIPFRVKSGKLFPLFGFDADIATDVKIGDDYDYPNKNEWNRLWLDFGIGGDIAINKHLFIRPQAIFGFSPMGAPEAYRAGGGTLDGASSDIKFSLEAGALWRF